MIRGTEMSQCAWLPKDFREEDVEDLCRGLKGLKYDTDRK